MSPSWFHLRGPTPSHPQVELWSSERLPFEPTGWKRVMRDQLRAEFRQLRPADGGSLEALFCSAATDLFDVENVLLYNVGSGAFTHLAGSGLRFERRYTPPPCPVALAAPALNYHRYATSLAPQQPEKSAMARWSFEGLSLRGDLKPDLVWLAMKRGVRKVSAHLAPGDLFGLQLRLEVPQGTSLNLAGKVKPLFDGIISAFQACASPPPRVVLERLRTRLQLDPEEVRSLLTARESAALGVVELVRPFGRGLQWHPSDDRCALGDLRVVQGHRWRCEGELIARAPRSTGG
jgi:hypothetical protein